MEATYKALATPDLIENIAERILGTHQKRMIDTTVINLLEDELRDTEKSISNLISCMEKGIVSSSTAKRLEELEKQKSDLEEKLALERTKESLEIQKTDIVDYLKNAIKKTPRLMIELIIKEVVLYKDKIEIHFNYTDLIRPDAEPRRAFSFYKFSQEVTIDIHRLYCPPIKKTIEFELFI